VAAAADREYQEDFSLALYGPQLTTLPSVFGFVTDLGTFWQMKFRRKETFTKQLARQQTTEIIQRAVLQSTIAGLFPRHVDGAKSRGGISTLEGPRP
jgi:hypothetical protein